MDNCVRAVDDNWRTDVAPLHPVGDMASGLRALSSQNELLYVADFRSVGLSTLICSHAPMIQTPCTAHIIGYEGVCRKSHHVALRTHDSLQI